MSGWRPTIAAFAGLLAVMAAAPASAATCTVSPVSVIFGSYDSLNPSPLDGVGSVAVNCDAEVAYTISLSAGTGTYLDRRMSAGAAELSYNLYTDSTRTQVWGDSTTSSGMSAAGTDVNLTIYGRIPARQNVTAGIYADTIIVTVTY